ncbi:MAG: ATP-dependent Clp protease adaptor ClpS [Kiritimatiellia bacterium]
MNNTNLKTVKRPRPEHVRQQDPICQVVLHNDDNNTVSHVIHCLQLVFAYDISLAAKIMLEAHARGRAIAEVEAETPAIEHRDQLRSYGLSATVEPI